MLYPERHIGALDAMAPVWTPGASCLYHPITYGSLLNEVVRRVTGKSVAKVFAEEIAAPLGLDFWIGLPAAEEPRVAPHFQATPGLSDDQLTAFIAGMGIDVETRLAKVVLNSFKHTGELIETMNNREARAAEVPAGNGIADARSLARMYAALIGEVDGVRLINPETLAKARTLRTGAMVPPGDLGKLPGARRNNTAWASSSPARARPCSVRVRSATPAPAAGSALPIPKAEPRRPTSPTPCWPCPPAPTRAGSDGRRRYGKRWGFS